MKIPTRQWVRWFVWSAILLASVLVIYPIGRFIPLQRDMTAAVRTAQSVRLEEFIYGETLTMKEVDAAQQRRLIGELPSDFRASVLIARCYKPHHRIVMKDTTGKEKILEICFGCNEARFTQGDVFMLPKQWEVFLRNLFSSLQIPIRSAEEYGKIELRNASE